MSDHDDTRADRDDKRADKKRAEGFSKLVDGVLNEESMPPALDADDRALLETATMIKASTQEVKLSSARVQELVDQALEQAVTGGRRLSIVPELDAAIPEPIPREDTDIIRLSRRRADRVIRALPWVVAGVAAAAALLLFLSRPENISSSAREQLAQKPIPHYQLSRPADPLVGQITPDGAALASSRLDIIYADRMAGYRELTLSGKKRSKQ